MPPFAGSGSVGGIIPPPEGAHVSTDTAATATSDYASAPNLRVTGSNAIEYAYRDLGASQRPLVLLQHFRGNLDNWDPALIDALASRRRVITFDNVGVAG